MRECNEPNCMNNNPYSPVLCPECMEHLLLHELTVEEVMDLYIETKSVLDDPELYKECYKEIFGDLEGIEDETLEQHLSNFKENLFDMVNTILKKRLEND